jgi:hypothetical protein
VYYALAGIARRTFFENSFEKIFGKLKKENPRKKCSVWRTLSRG